MLATALLKLGAAVCLADRRRTPPLDTGACFSQPVGGEIMMSGQKVVGSAQLRSGNALLQHGSVLLCNTQDLVRELMKEDQILDPPSLGKEPWAAATDVAEAITSVATRRWEGNWECNVDEAAVLQEASGHYSHYSSAAWTWSR
jgi:lipoate-protein ligase A